VSTNALRFMSLLSTALVTGASLAHLLELPNKIKLPGPDYLVVQQIYRGWALLGILVAGALFSTLALAVTVRSDRQAVMLTLAALTCLVATQMVFWVFTYPVNRQTNNWTVLPATWQHLRNQWEYSHAVSAGLNLIALVSLFLSVLRSRS
jgi:hypothetical protein